jgi:hypothetical protein
MFELPPIDYRPGVPELLRDRYTTRSLLTYLRGHGRVNIANQAVPGHFNTDQELMNWLSENISTMIQEFLIVPNPPVGLAESIFHSIQIWGGFEARRFYIHNNTIDVSHYINSMRLARAGDAVGANVLLRHNYRYFNISFASKHYAFWTSDLPSTQNEGPRQLPILDSLLFGLAYGSAYPDYRHYSAYLVDMYQFIGQYQNLTVHSLERQLFNFADTPEGRNWINYRLNANHK